MNFNGFLSSRLAYDATRSAKGFAVPTSEEGLAERTLIAQELDDTLVQGILAVSIQLRAAVDRLPADYAASKPRFSGVLQAMECVSRGRTARGAGTALIRRRMPVSRSGSAASGMPVVMSQLYRGGTPNDHVRFGSIADIDAPSADVRFACESGHAPGIALCLPWANNGRCVPTGDR